MKDSQKNAKPVSIGTVARETGISIESLRMWERRYGAPKSIRLPSGHRRYPASEVTRLRAVVRAMEHGYRAGQVAAAPLEQLMAILSSVRHPDARARQRNEPPGEHWAEPVLARWADATEQLDEPSLTQEFYNDWAALGPMRFIRERVIPFLTGLGDGWERGQVTVAQEHFASERLDDFLSAMWRRPNERATGAPLLLATLPGDLHRLGLQMCAVAAAVAERRILYLGPQTPPEEIADAAHRSGSVAVVISVSTSVDGDAARESLRGLRARLDERVALLVGGRGAVSDIAGVSALDDFDDFLHWAKARPSAVGGVPGVGAEFFA